MSMSPANACLSFSIIVLAPTVLWTSMIWAAAYVCRVDLPQVAITAIAVMVGGFLSVIWTLLIANRSHPRD